MIGKKVESSRFVPLFEVKEHVKNREADGELTYEQTLTKEYVRKFSRLSKGKGEKFLAEITKLTNDEALAVKIADTMPDSVERLRLLYQKGAKIETPQLEEIVKVIKKYSK